jgi:hypothetical protein
MGLANKSVIDQLTSKARSTGLFRAVNGHEPKGSPEKGLTCAVWADAIAPSPTSGLNSTSAVVTFMIRLYTPMISEPQDMIDPTLVAAADKIMGDITADFTLGGTVRQVDLLGSHGAPFGAQAGYVEIGGTVFRIIDITTPCVINDAWPQGV